MNYYEIASNILENVGGIENVNTITRCSTRLRLFVNNTNQINIDKVKEIKPVLGAILVGNELQIILAHNLIPIFNETVEIEKKYQTEGKQSVGNSPKIDGDEDVKKSRLSKVFNTSISFISASVTPMIPGLVAGGMIKVLLVFVTLINPSYENANMYILLNMLADFTFYFMPVFVAYGAAKKLNATPIYAMIVAAGLVAPQFIEFVKVDEMIKLGPIAVPYIKYGSTLVPAILIGLTASYLEKGLDRIIPKLLKPILVGSLTILITWILAITILGPLGDYIGMYVVDIFLWAQTHLGPFSVALLAASMPFLVMTGMHHAVTPFMVQSFANPGYDAFFRPAYLLHNMSEGGACLGVAFKTKDKALRSECFALAFSCIFAGVTEPAIYGINLRLKKPIIAVVIGSASGGFVSGLLGATAFEYGYSSLLAAPIFKETMGAILIAILVSITVTAVVTYIMGFDEKLLD